MTAAGESKEAPICIDCSPGPSTRVPVSPVKLASPRALPKCRYSLLLTFLVKARAICTFCFYKESYCLTWKVAVMKLLLIRRY